MHTVELLLLALALSADALTVTSAIALSHRGNRRAFRIVFHFGLFQALFALAGALAGSLLLGLISNWDHWAAFLILAWLGGRMILSGMRGDHSEDRIPVDLTRGWTMVGLSIAVSIDALAAGISLPTLRLPLSTAALVIGFITSFNSALAWNVARLISKRWRSGIEIAGGLILVGIGMSILTRDLALF